MAETLPGTLRLAGLALALETAVGLAAGTVAAVTRRRAVDSAVMAGSTLVIGVPGFVVAVAAQYVFGVRLGWLPVAGTEEGWIGLVLPAGVLALLGTAWTSRLLQASLEEAMDTRYVVTAGPRAWGGGGSWSVTPYPTRWARW